MKQDRYIAQPPKWADRFFEWYCNSDLQEEIQGDLIEQFHDKVESDGIRTAKLWYWLNVFLFINKYTLRRERNSFTRLNTLDMFQNYFKTGFRTLSKNRLSTFVNALGMALAIGCCLVCFKFIDWIYNTDQLHENRDEIYVVERWVDRSGNVGLSCPTPDPLGPALMEDFPAVQNMSRLAHSGGIVQYGDHVFNEGISFVDNSFYELFDFPIKWGNTEDFVRPDAIVLTEAISKKYFGEKNPIGEEMKIRFRDDEEGNEVVELFTVRGVFEDYQNSKSSPSFGFNMLIPWNRQLIWVDDFTDWTRHTSITFIQVPNPQDIALLESNQENYLAPYNQVMDTEEIKAFHFQPLKGISRHAYQVANSPFYSSHIAAIIMLGMIALALLIMVCFNYMNIALASASARLKEISVRKVMGSSRGQIIVQFLTENVLVCLIALGLGVLLAETLFLPWFNGLADFAFEFNYWENPRLWLMIVLMVLVTAIGGAGYPALYISKFEPVSILKSKMALGGKNRFRKALLGTQFLLTFITICCAFTFAFETKNVKARSWGYDPTDMVIVEMNNAGDFEKLKGELLQRANVKSVGGAQGHIGNWNESIAFDLNGEEHSSESFSISYNYLQTMGIELADGRFFEEGRETDQTEALIVNETFRKEYGWDKAVGKQLKIDNKTLHIVGEVKDFHFRPFDVGVDPIVFKMGDPTNFRHVAVKVEDGTMIESAKTIEESWKALFPSVPYDFFYQDDVFNNYFLGFEQVTRILKATSFLTIIIAIVGMFGLAMLLLSRKMKEVSIRKVLGANMLNLSWLINKEFFYTIIIASILGAPVSWFFMRLLFDQISPESVMGALPVILTVIILIAMSLISVSRHIYRAAVANPTVFLKEE